MAQTHKEITALLCCGLIILSAACGCRAEKTETVVTTAETVSEPPVSEVYAEKGKPLQTIYFDRNSFSLHTNYAEEYGSDGEIFCGIVPHHLLAGRLIAGFLQAASASRQRTDTVVVTATMHFTEDNPVCTSFCDWDTPFGRLECDEQLTEKLIAETGAVCDDETAQLDHGISALVPYIKYYFPDSEIAFLLVDEKADKSLPDKLAELYCSIDSDCLYLFSADFSHYLPAHETERRDLETIEAVAEKDYEKISSMTDDNVDSPYVLGTFVRLAEKSGAETKLLGRSNSMLISDIPYSEKAYPDGLTSYLVYCAEKPMEN